MPPPKPNVSTALWSWLTRTEVELKQFRDAHRSISGARPGRRALQELNHAYLVAVAAKFQLFSRDLHTEAVDVFASQQTSPALALLVRTNFAARELKRGNANAGNIGSDFGRLVPGYWDLVKADSPRNPGRAGKLARLNAWRNAVAHQDFAQGLMPKSVRLHDVEGWRTALTGLARSMNDVTWRSLLALFGSAPW